MIRSLRAPSHTDFLTRLTLALPWVLLVWSLAILVFLQPYSAGYGPFRRTLAATVFERWLDPTWQHGALALPGLELWSYTGQRSWWEPLESTRLERGEADPLRLQLLHFLRVISGAEPPIITARDALETLRVVAAVKLAAATGDVVELGR